MFKSASKSELATFIANLDKWESTKQGSHSSLREVTKSAQRSVALIIAPLNDTEKMIVIDAFRECVSCGTDDDGEGTPRSLPWSALVERTFEGKSATQHAHFYALLAPIWNKLNGRNGNPGYDMSQAIYTIRDEANSMSINTVMNGERAEELRNKLIGTMMFNDVRGDGGFDYEEIEWFGANWERVAPLWQMLKSGKFDRSRAEAMIEHHRNGGVASISTGVL